MLLLGGGPGLYFDFARLSFHVPIIGWLCASPACGNAVAPAKPSSAIVVKVRRFMIFLPLLLIMQKGAPRTNAERTCRNVMVLQDKKSSRESVPADGMSAANSPGDFGTSRWQLG